MPNGTVLVILQALWLVVTCVALGVAWKLRRDAAGHAAAAHRCLTQAQELLAVTERGVAAARRAGIDVDMRPDA